MSISDAVSRMSQIQAELANLQSAFVLPASSASSGASATTTPDGAEASAGTAGTSFSSQLTSAMTPTTAALDPSGGASLGGAQLPANATTMLSSGQQQFASRLAADTGMDPGVISAWMLAEESGGAATSRQSAGNNDWLNIGYTGSGTFGAGDSVWGSPVTAADATAGWLKGQNTIPGYGTASSGIQAILTTAGQPAATQISALQNSGWAGSGYPDLPSLYQQVAG
jgi:hypothetical protein